MNHFLAPLMLVLVGHPAALFLINELYVLLCRVLARSWLAILTTLAAFYAWSQMPNFLVPMWVTSPSHATTIQVIFVIGYIYELSLAVIAQKYL